MENHDKIKDLFADKLGNYQAPVNSELWSAISSQIATTTVVTTSVSLATKLIIGISAAGIIGVGAYFFLDNEESPDSIENVAVVSENKNLENSNEQVDVDEIEVSSQEQIEKSVPDSEREDVQNYSTPDKNHNVLLKDKQNERVEHHINKEKVGVLKEREESPRPFVNDRKPKVSDERMEETTDKSDKPTVVVNAPNVEHKKSSVEITKAPNVYSTKHDGAFSIDYTGKFLDYSFVVLDLNNKIVFETNNPDFKWYGEMMNGDIIPAGRYFYLVSGRDEQGNKVSKSQQLDINPN